MPTSSLLITSHPHEPLPLYTRDIPGDSETASNHSAAPSYVSAAPSYHSSTSLHSSSPSTSNPPQAVSAHTSLPSAANTQTSSGGLLSSSAYAPGFENRAHGPAFPGVSNPNVAFNYLDEWSAVTSNLQSSPNQKATRMRATMAMGARARNPTRPVTVPYRSMIPNNSPGERHRPADDPIPIISPFAPPSTISGSHTNSSDSSDEDGNSDPRSPPEDQDLVGEFAATRATETRQRESSENSGNREDDLTLKQDARAWDFMMTQMADWEKRERNWKRFREDVGKSRPLARRLGFKGRC